MGKLRLFGVLLSASVASCLFGSGLTAQWYDRKLTRLVEERETYASLLDSAVRMSERSLSFAQKYQETLDLCMARALPLNPIHTATRVSAGRGGIGGPVDVRAANRLP